MSQERTEQTTLEKLKEAFPKEEHSPLMQVAADQIEQIDRLNAVITGQAETINAKEKGIHEQARAIVNLTAKAQERDKEIERLEAKEARLIHEARGASEDALKEAEENAELREEIERLRAALLAVKMTGWRDGVEDNDGRPYIESNFESVEIAIETLKGAE